MKLCSEKSKHSSLVDTEIWVFLCKYVCVYKMHIYWVSVSLQYSRVECSSLFFFFCFLGPHPQYVDVPRPGVELELQRPAYATATAVWDLSCICNLYYSSQQQQILNPWVRPGIEPTFSCVLVRFITCWATRGTLSMLKSWLRHLLAM